jgi:hypothetical protein
MCLRTERRASSRHTSWSDVALFSQRQLLTKLEMFALCAQCQLEAWRSILKIMTNETEIYWCRKCQSETLTANPACVKCGRKMQTQSTIKSLGKLLIGLGILITLGSGLGVLAAVLVLMFAKLKPNEMPTAFAALMACVAVSSAGIAAIFGGWRQSQTGRTSKAFMWLFLGLVVLILILGQVFSFLKG